MMFKRKIYDKLVQWRNESNGDTAVLIDGARRVGKSTVAEAFGQSEYAKHVVVDFAHPKTSVVDVIKNDPGNLDAFFKMLEYEYRVKLVERNSLIVFDEVQLCPEARQMVKYLVADHRYDYLETGSLVAIEENVANIVVPSEEEHLDMFPMDFEEFSSGKSVLTKECSPRTTLPRRSGCPGGSCSSIRAMIRRRRKTEWR